MTNSDTRSASVNATAGRRDVSSVVTAMARLVESAEAAVVFSSLAEVCVPAFSDSCVITVEEDTGATYRIAYPRADPDATVTPLVSQHESHEIAVRIDLSAGVGLGGHALIVHRWRNYEPDGADAGIAQLIADRAAAVIRCERLAAEAARLAGDALNLRQALESNRQIGTAIGILMANHKISGATAFDVLRASSRNENRKLRDIAADIVTAGGRDLA